MRLNRDGPGCRVLGAVAGQPILRSFRGGKKSFLGLRRDFFEGPPRSARYPRKFKPRKCNNISREQFGRPIVCGRVFRRRGCGVWIENEGHDGTSDPSRCCDLETLLGVLAAVLDYWISRK